MTTLEQIQNKLPFTIKANQRIGYYLLGAWVLLMIGMPWLQFFFGDDIIPLGVVAAAILQASAVFYFVQSQWGLLRTTLTFLIVAVLTWGAEFIGHTTSFPFGAYQYTDILQPQIAGVPLLIPVAWFMLLPSSWVMAQLIVGNRSTLQGKLAFIGMSAIALTVWDLFLDPQMVAWGFWVWDNPVGYFGIPYSNYFGWLLVAAIVTTVVNPPKLEVFPLALIYGIVWFLQMIGQGVIWQQIGPAIVGTIAMGAIMVLAYWRSQEQIE
ncbi:MAG: carotenoid biosynthesis protein [Phototrophicaceae bacterium]